MPGAAANTLLWLPEQNSYQLFTQGNQDIPLLQGDDTAWFAWLAAHSSFSFQGQYGHLNLLKEARSRGDDGYWYAYQRLNKRKVKRYAGKSADLTMTRLETVARTLAALATPLSPPTENPLEKDLAHQARDRSLPTSLLIPKLLPPRLPSTLVLRERLLVQLDTGLERKLTLLTAPAGFGKTTLVRQWINERARQDQRPTPTAWVSLDPEDDDPARFWYYVLTACQSFVGLGHVALAQLSMDQLSFTQLSLKSILTTFLNEAARLAERNVLVLEDYHVVTASQIHESLVFMLDHLPATLHLVVITRSEPPFPLARWRAKDEIQEIYAADLRFSQQEIAVFLQQQKLPEPLSSAMVTHLETHVEGWITGLRLLTLALQRQTEPQKIERILTTFTGSHRYLLDYFTAEVLAAQEETLQTFLLQTSMLSRMTASLCDAVTMRNDSARLLIAIEQAGLFLQSLDGVEPWYRYHMLFAEAMQTEARRRLGDDALRACLDRAGIWYEQNGMLADAVEVALQTAEWPRAALLMEKYIETRRVSERYEATLLRWLEPLPEQVLEAHPSLCLTYAMTLLFALDRSSPATMTLVQAPLQMAERGFQIQGASIQLGAVLTIRALLAWWQEKLPLAFTTARQALEVTPETEIHWRSTSLLITAVEALLAGKLEAARYIILETYALFEACENTFGLRASMTTLGEIYAQQGNLHQAAQLYRQVLAEAREDPLDQGVALLNLARLSYEWNDLKAAEEEAEQALEIGRQHISMTGKYHMESVI